MFTNVCYVHFMKLLAILPRPTHEKKEGSEGGLEPRGGRDGTEAAAAEILLCGVGGKNEAGNAKQTSERASERLPCRLVAKNEIVRTWKKTGERERGNYEMKTLRLQ